MKKLFVVFLLLSACQTTERKPSSEAPILSTRDQKPVFIPHLKVNLAIPACPTDMTARKDKKDKDECILTGENELFDKATKLSGEFQTAQNPPTERISQRDFHPKQHACLAGTWMPLEVDASLKIGVFGAKLNKPVAVVLRYSNGSPKSPTGNGKLPPDGMPDARGLALKLVGVPGESILAHEDTVPGEMNQDFVLINDPAFFLSGPQTYPEFLSLIRQGKPFFHLMTPTELGVLKRTNRVVPDVVAERFFSQTPYALGEEQKVKYSVRPCVNEPVASVTEAEMTNPNFLRTRIKDRLRKNNICLIFSIQRRLPHMDVEDSAMEWKAEESPFVDVARIQIPKNQDIDDPQRDGFCENISFNPWNTLLEHRPAGGINRARLAVYSGISRKRRLENQVPIREPRAQEPFFEVLKNH